MPLDEGSIISSTLKMDAATMILFLVGQFTVQGFGIDTGEARHLTCENELLGYLAMEMGHRSYPPLH
jgi:hypothetical protein